ncbi:MAG: L-seryl-tRNA(Sec) selenium transferase [Candidatus Promineofilum sp.]|uniref:L-seryl-tRNA(Sec) selenium transferase n=1 Tax=Promineifilum sp. TaxID=2664178 RepID=UPI002411F2CE|nr:L-seryl-tRNA(Sec) selenium transferase [Promineifilum sp.]
MTTSPGRAALRDLPSIDRLLRAPGAGELVDAFGRAPATDALRAVLDETRAALLGRAAGGDIPPDFELVSAARERLAAALAPTLRPVINATGVIIHTNLGRAPLSAAALAAAQQAAEGYATLEYDLDEGRRGSRAVHAEHLLTRLTGAEAALVVNNNAAAVLLMLAALCRDQEVIISRGQLVEIGGGFRIPDVLAQSGARLVEVGTTNRTHRRDYADAITADTAAILAVHHSNYKIIGFAGQPDLADLAATAHEQGLLLLFDQGSGALRDVGVYGLEPEPTVLDGIKAGCDVVAFSGDKLLGGPQAGILIGRAALIERLRRHPLARAVRADKLALAALAATLTHYLTDDPAAIPVWRMIARPLDDIAAEAEAWAARLRSAGLDAATTPGESFVGGGSLPGQSLPTRVVAVTPHDVGPDELAARLRAAPTPVIARIRDGRLLLDPRTVLPGQTDVLLRVLQRATKGAEQ